MDELEIAIVLWWTGRSLRVKCPYCLESHGHCISPDATVATCRSLIRRSYCTESGGDYRIVFPYESDTAVSRCGWEVSKSEGLVYTVTRDGRLQDPRDQLGRSWWHETVSFNGEQETNTDGPEPENALLESMNNMKLSGTTDQLDEPNAKDQQDDPNVIDQHDHSNARQPDIDEILRELHEFAEYRKTVYFSACARCDVAGLENLLAKYEDNFMHMTDKLGGNGVFYAAAEENGLETLKWLQAKGVNVKQANHHGRTALHEAALWAVLPRPDTLSSRVSIQNVEIMKDSKPLM